MEFQNVGYYSQLWQYGYFRSTFFFIINPFWYWLFLESIYLSTFIFLMDIENLELSGNKLLNLLDPKTINNCQYESSREVAILTVSVIRIQDMTSECDALNFKIWLSKVSLSFSLLYPFEYIDRNYDLILVSEGKSNDQSMK